MKEKCRHLLAQELDHLRYTRMWNKDGCWLLLSLCIVVIKTRGCAWSNFPVSSLKPVTFMRCGHPIHKKCLQSYSMHHYTCPICSKAIGDLSSINAEIEAILNAQGEMPEEYRDATATVLCKAYPNGNESVLRSFFFSTHAHQWSIWCISVLPPLFQF